MNCDIRSWIVVRVTAKNGVGTVRWRWGDADLFLAHEKVFMSSKVAKTVPNVILHIFVPFLETT